MKKKINHIIEAIEAVQVAFDHYSGVCKNAQKRNETVRKLKRLLVFELGSPIARVDLMKEIDSRFKQNGVHTGYTVESNTLLLVAVATYAGGCTESQIRETFARQTDEDFQPTARSGKPVRTSRISSNATVVNGVVTPLSELRMSAA